MLLDREDELAACERGLDAAREGQGALLLVEAGAGMGKTMLLGELRDRARESGMRCLQARPGKLERDFAFGAARQLLEPALAAAEPERVAELTSGAARHALAVVEDAIDGDPADAETDLRVLHGLYWLVANLADERPLVLTVDDAHWADVPSLRFLTYLARRLGELPVLVAVAARPEARPEAHDLLDELADDPVANVLRPPPLSPDAVTALVRDAYEQEPEQGFADAVRRITRGNPFYVRELLRAARDAEIDPVDACARRLDDLGPDAVARSVLRRVEGVGPAAAAVAHAVAVLGVPSVPTVVAAVAGVDDATALEVAGALMRAEVFESAERLDFAHPIVGASISERLGPAALGELHAKAAEVLAATGAEPDRIAAHVAQVPPGMPIAASVGEVGPLLLDAARRVLARGAPEAAAGFLERALRAELSDEARREALLALARAELRTLSPDAVRRYEAVQKATPDAADRAQIGLELVEAMPFAGLFREAATAAEHMLAEPGLPAPARAALEAQLLACRTMDLGEEGDTGPRLDELVERALAGEATEPAQRSATAWALVMSGRDVAGGVGLALDVLDEPSLHEPGGSGTLAFAALAAMMSDRGGELLPLFDRLLADAARTGSQRIAIWAAAMRGLLLLRRGDLRGATADLRTVQALWSGHDPYASRAWLVAPMVATLAETGGADVALRLLAEHTPPEPWPPLFQFALLRHARGTLALRTGRAEDALLDLLVCGDLAAQSGVMPEVLPWRSAAALCYRALGDPDRGRELADEEVALAREAGVERAIGRALCAAGVCRRGEESVAMLQEAIEVLGRTDAALELARAEIELGALLRRLGRRVDSREVLRVGVDRATRCGAEVLLAQGVEELTAAGARPRRERISGVESLTAAERRVVDLAAEGATNREIAQALFLTQKTVETHLSSTYRKLDISSRNQLREVLAGAG